VHGELERERESTKQKKKDASVAVGDEGQGGEEDDKLLF